VQGTPLPAWVFKGPVAEAGGVHTPQGSWNPTTGGKFEPRRSLPVYSRQLFPELLLGSGPILTARQARRCTKTTRSACGRWTIRCGDRQHQDQDARHQPRGGRGPAAGRGLAEKDYQGVVIWSGDEPFSAGADLQAMLPAFMMGVSAIDEAEGHAADHAALRYANVPVVSAIRGLALGGGCELAVHSARRVAAMESYIGLVEVGVGLVPGAGGLTYIARRAAENAAASPPTRTC
jgi:3-hydroxyacyl-CoA dehydrogenase